MATLRQKKISELLRRELSMLFQREAISLCKGTIVTPTVVRISSDLSIARVYLSIFAPKSEEEVYKHILTHNKKVRAMLADQTRNQLRKIPELHFFIDDSINYAANIDSLLK